MGSDYIVRLKCPYGDEDRLLTLENRQESLNQILETPWNFECSIHGVQTERPLEGNYKHLWSGSQSRRKETKSAIRELPQLRSSKRISLHLPVLVSRGPENGSSFQEETKTLLVNSSGGLLTLASRVAVGDTIFITNRETQRKQECRVAYVANDTYGKLRVGAAFKRSAPSFWRLNRRESRIFKNIRVNVRGLDRNGHAFARSSYAVDISRHGACLEGIGELACPGETIRVTRHWRTARFRVVWVGQIGTPQAGRIGVIALEPDKNVWGVTLS